MPLPVPRTLSPSKMSSFTDCALAFRFSAIDRLPEPPSVAATRGTLVHTALEQLFCAPPEERTLATALAALPPALERLRPHPDLAGLELDAAGEQELLTDAEGLVRRYFELEDPSRVRPIGLELRLEVEVGDVVLRGVIDRLDLDADGSLVVTDYKTGRAPSVQYERSRLGGVHFYAYLCERLFGARPAKVQLLYLADPVAIVAVPTDQSSRGLERKVAALWTAVERACARDDFRPKPSPLCDWCAFKAYCPAWGGDPALASTAAPPPLATVG